MLFRKGYLTVVVATGTLAMGINMPCKTVVFTGDSIFLTALNYRQASGRAGRRGFDMLGNVVFHHMPPHRALEVMSAKLPDLRGQFPASVTLILRLFILLHGTDNSSFAADAVKSLITQSRLYLGGPEAKMSIPHHLRFSIDYLRRQNMLSKTGVPLNFAGLVDRLHYTESAAFAFQALLQGGYFHEVCAGFSPTISLAKWREMALELVLTLSHLFVRIPYTRPRQSQTTRKTALPPLPEKAHQLLARHNAETLSIFRGYVQSYVSQYLSDTPDTTLPLTQHTISSTTDLTTTLPHALPHLPPVTIRSPFSALSGLNDTDFATTAELCETVRAGVPLEGSVIPGVPVNDGTVEYNSYLLDFFRNGDAEALKRDNGISAGDVWFRLKDFSLVLATIGASLEGLLAPGGVVGGDGDLADVDGGPEEGDGGWQARGEAGTAGALATMVVGAGKKKAAEAEKKKKKKKVVADSWDDEDVSSSEESEAESENAWSETTGQTGTVLTRASDGDGPSLVKVCEAFRRVQREFDDLFFKMWA
jgi:hypothetical protein